jgi:hypothetical protein
MPQLIADRTRGVDIIGIGPDFPADENRRRCFFCEDRAQGMFPPSCVDPSQRADGRFMPGPAFPSAEGEGTSDP